MTCGVATIARSSGDRRPVEEIDETCPEGILGTDDEKLIFADELLKDRGPVPQMACGGADVGTSVERWPDYITGAS